LKIVKKNWSHDLKHASIHLQKHKAPSQEANPQALAWQTWKVSVRRTRSMPVELQSDRFIWTTSCDAVWSSKFL